MRKPVIACGTCILMAAAAVAAQLSEFAIEGLRLGMPQAAVREVYPYMHFEAFPYLDSRVEDRYAPFYGSLAVERIEGHAVVEKEDVLSVVKTTLTGDGRLVAVSVFAEREAMDCRELSRTMRERYGEPTIDDAPASLVWIEKNLDARRSLRFTCYDRKSYGLTLVDRGAQADYLRSIRRTLEPYILETLQQVH